MGSADFGLSGFMITLVHSQIINFTKGYFCICQIYLLTLQGVKPVGLHIIIIIGWWTPYGET